MHKGIDSESCHQTEGIERCRLLGTKRGWESTHVHGFQFKSSSKVCVCMDVFFWALHQVDVEQEVGSLAQLGIESVKTSHRLTHMYLVSLRFHRTRWLWQGLPPHCLEVHLAQWHKCERNIFQLVGEKVAHNSMNRLYSGQSKQICWILCHSPQYRRNRTRLQLHWNLASTQCGCKEGLCELHCSPHQKYLCKN